MLGRQIKLLGDETDIVSLYYHLVDNFQIQFGREEFCLVTGLRFEVDYWADYNNEDDPIPFRRLVFSSAKDGNLQFVLLGLEDTRGVPDWILRDANVRRWPNLYAIEPRRYVDKKGYLMFGFTWAFKGRLPTERLTPDKNEARSDWAMDQMLKKEAEREKMYKKMRKFMQDMSVGPVRQPNKGPIIVDQHYGLSDFSKFQSMQGGPSSFPTQGNISFFEDAQATLSYGHNMATPNWQTPIPSHPGTSNWQT
ncbi:hypothetical protein Tco_0185998 [Tanacetum coccineum]